MWAWLVDNYITILAMTAVLLLIVLAVFTLVRDKKRGKSSCGGNCMHCPMGGSCHGNGK